jgi:hypothetical protein
MARKSTVDRLDPKVRAQIIELRDRGRTIDEIMAKLAELNLPENVSRSAVGRWVQNADRITARIRQSREICQAIVKDLGQAPESKAARFNIEVMQASIMELVSACDSTDPLDLKTVRQLSAALADLSRAAKLDIDNQLTIKREAIKEAAEKAETVAKEAGLSAATIDTIRKSILGIST